MKIAIDLNDVIRDYTDNFLSVYLNYYNHEFDPSDIEFWTNDMQAILPFKNDRAYQTFVYTDFAFELFAKADVCTRKLKTELCSWVSSLKDLEYDEPVEVMIVSPFEYGESINYSYFFVSKLGTGIREIYFPEDSSDIWNRCDVLITANPNLLDGVPEGKKTVKIKKDYNNDSPSTMEFNSLSAFLKDENNLVTLMKNVQ